MAQIQKKFIANNAVDADKIRLANNTSLKARNAANSGDVNILKVNASDKVEFASVPQSTADATTSNDLVRFSQLASLAEGFKPKASVAVASTADIDLAVAADPGLVDGYTLQNNDRILLKDQADSAENGIYVVVSATDPTTWTRASDYNAVSEITGSYTVVANGDESQGSVYITTSSPVTLGTDPILFVRRANPSDLTGGNMITVSGGEISVDLATVSGLESTVNDASGQLRVKLEATDPTLQIDVSNQLGVKLNAGLAASSSGVDVQVDGTTIEIGGISNELGVRIDTTGAIEAALGGLAVKVDAVSVTINGSNQLEVGVDAAGAIEISGTGLAAKVDDSTIAISGVNELEVKLDTAGAVVAGLTGLKVNLEISNPTLQIDGSNQLGVKLDAAGAIITGASGVAVKVDSSTIKIDGSNQLIGTQSKVQQITLTGTDITNQYVDLAKAAKGASASDNSILLSVVGGLIQTKTVDYTVDLTGGTAGVTRIDFIGDLATAGAAALVAGDILVINYEYID